MSSFPNDYNQLLLAYYKTNGATSNDLQDAEYEFLIAQGATPATIPDMWFEWLGSLSYTGALSDRIKSFWCVGGGALYGAEILLPDDLDWTSLTNATVTGGVINMSPTSVLFSAAGQNASPEFIAGESYRVVYTIVSSTGGTLVLSNTGFTGTIPLDTEVGEHTVVVICTITNGSVRLAATSPGSDVIVVEPISVRRILS